MLIIEQLLVPWRAMRVGLPVLSRPVALPDFDTKLLVRLARAVASRLRAGRLLWWIHRSAGPAAAQVSDLT